MQNFTRALSLTVPLFLTASLAPTASAQDRPAKGSAAAVLARFERAYRTDSATTDANGQLRTLLWSGDRSRPAFTDSLLSGLENLALKSEDRDIRVNATTTLASAGYQVDHPVPNVFDRVARIYRSTDDWSVRMHIILSSSWMAERSKAIRLLKSVAAQHGTSRDYEDAPWHAVGSLHKMGAEGRVALRDLQRQGTVRDPKAQGFVQWSLSTEGANK